MIWNKTKECMSRDEMHHLQSARLHSTVKRVYHNVPFYREKMQQLGLEPGDIQSIEDLSKLPFTTKKTSCASLPSCSNRACRLYFFSLKSDSTYFASSSGNCMFLFNTANNASDTI